MKYIRNTLQIYFTHRNELKVQIKYSKQYTSIILHSQKQAHILIKPISNDIKLVETADNKFNNAQKIIFTKIIIFWSCLSESAVNEV